MEMIPFDGDTLRLVYPSWFIGKQLLMKGLFLWDPNRLMGLPFLAHSPNQALYPFRFLSIFLNFFEYQRLFVVFHDMLLMFFGFAIVYRLGRHKEASVLAAVGLAFNGFVVSKATVNIDFSTMAWLPAAIYFFEQRKMVLLALVLVLQWFAGFPTFVIMTGLFLLCLCFAESPWKSIVFLAKASLLAAGLAAIQWIPFLEMLRASVRPVMLSDAGAFEYSLTFQELLRGIFVPSIILNHLKPLSLSDISVVGFYLGPILFFLFVMGCIYGNRRDRIIAAVALFGFLLSTGSSLPLYRFIPFVRIFRFPAHWLLLGMVGAVLVASTGLKNITNKKIQRAIVFLVAADFLIFAWPGHTYWGDSDFINKAPSQLQSLGSPLPKGRVFHTDRITAYVDKWGVVNQEQWFTFLRLLVPSSGIPLGIREVNSRHQLSGKRNAAYVQRLNSAPITSPLFEYAGVEKIVTLRELSLDAMPPSENILVLTPPAPKAHCFILGEGTLKVISDEPGKILLETSGPGKVVVSEVYCKGWDVFVDGKKKVLGLFENTFLEVDVAGGFHTVLFSYRPFTVLFGGSISLLTLIGLIVVCSRKIWES